MTKQARKKRMDALDIEISNLDGEIMELQERRTELSDEYETLARQEDV